MVSFQVTERHQAHWQLEANLLFLTLHSQPCELRLHKIPLPQLCSPATFSCLCEELTIIPIVCNSETTCCK